METQRGWYLRPEEFRIGFEKVDDLVYYDGPLLSHYTSPNGKAPHYLFKYIDQNESSHRWLIIEVSLFHLYDYLTNACSLRDIFEKDYNHKLYVADSNNEGDFVSSLLVMRSDLLEYYIPNEKSYYGMAMSDDYISYFEEEAEKEIPFAAYIAKQRSRSVQLKLTPSDKQHASTVGAGDIASFLQKITRSFRGYVEARFNALFREMFTFEEQATRALSRLLEEAEPRAVNAGFGSFEIDLALDVLTLAGLPSTISDWQKQALVEYREDVLDFNFKANLPLPERLRDVDDDLLRVIFGPIVQVANSTSYVAQSRSTVKQPFNEIKSAPPKDVSRVIPSKPKSKIEEEAETEFANVLLQWKKGQDLTNITPKQLRQALIAVTIGDESIAQISDFISSEGVVISFVEPIDVNLSKTGTFTEASYEPLGIKVLGANGGAALDGFLRELSRLYSVFILQDRSIPPSGESTKQQRISAAFAELLGE